MSDVVGAVREVVTWPVKSMGGGLVLDAVRAEVGGLAGDRAWALVDRRPLRAGNVLSARNLPGILRWSVERLDRDEPVLAAPDGRSWRWSDPGLSAALTDDLGVPVGLTGPGAHADLVDSVLVTTVATHAGVEEGFGHALDRRRWRTNLHLDLSAPAFAEAGWEGRHLHVGEVRFRLLHPCKRCAIPSWSPDGRERSPELLAYFHGDGGRRSFGINARVVEPGTVRAGDEVVLR